MKSNSLKNIIVYVPPVVGYIGAIEAGIFVGLVVFFMLTSEETIHWSCFAIFGTFVCMGLYMVLLSWRWRVIVKDNEITVQPLLTKKYSFSFDDIIFIRRQVKNNRVDSERVIIKTKNKQRLIVERAHVSYFKFVSNLIEKTDTKIQAGFEDYRKK